MSRVHLLSNNDIADIIQEISDYYRNDPDEKFRANSFAKAAINIRRQAGVITSGKDARKIPGVGKSTADVIDELLTTGSVVRLEELRGQVPKEKKKITDYFETFFEIGPATAEFFYESGYRTLHDLWTLAPLTQNQRLGILWRDHLMERVSREEMDIIHEIVASILQPLNVRWEITGSYRRNTPSSGDIDILIETSENVTLAIVIDLLRRYLPDTFSADEVKFMGIFRISDSYYGHHIDILMVPPEKWYYALLHFTGPRDFNILMSKHAQSLSMKLSKEGLKSLDGDYSEYPATSEHDIFDYVGVRYLTPEERSNVTVLPLVEY